MIRNDEAGVGCFQAFDFCVESQDLGVVVLGDFEFDSVEHAGEVLVLSDELFLLPGVLFAGLGLVLGAGGEGDLGQFGLELLYL